MKHAFWIVAAGALVLSVGVSCGGAPEDVFAGTTKIVLTKDLQKDPAKKTVEIVDKAEIAEFVAAITLEKKHPCACDHVESATFTALAREIRVSLCDHCFDFDGKTWAMPAWFYKLFKQHYKE